MGKGKGAPEYWVAVIKPGTILFEAGGVNIATAKEALKLGRRQAADEDEVHDQTRLRRTIKVMKNSEIKALSVAELKEKLASEKEAIRKMKFAHQVSAIENPMKIRETRKLVARIKTELTAKELQK